jgi:uncharacterized protein YjbI with pentapeptide repeats
LTTWFTQRGLPWGTIIVSALLAVVASWPLAEALWNLLGLGTEQAARMTALGFCAVLLTAGIAGLNRRRTTPVRLVWLILSAWAVAAGAVALMTGLAWLALDTPQWIPPEELTPRGLDSIATRAFAIVAGLGGVALLVISYRRQRTTETSDQREETKLFNERFTTAYTELGHEHAAVRLGAVHALAHLADDAPQGRDDLVQTVIDVLCAYLRMPYEPLPEPPPSDADKAQLEGHLDRKLTFAAMREVRHTIIRIIGNHLREETRWRGKDYDFTGTVFDGGNLSQTAFSDSVVSFVGARFINGMISFSSANFDGSVVSFEGARFDSGHVTFKGAQFNGGDVSFEGARFNGTEVSFENAHINGGELSFIASRFNEGALHLINVEFNSGVVYFTKARFNGSEVYFSYSQFNGSNVSFTQSRFNSGMVHFGKASGTCPKGLLQCIQQGAPNLVVGWPSHWQDLEQADTPVSSSEQTNEDLD